MKLLVVVAVAMLAGCASVNGGPNMNVDQIKAMVADKNAYAVCSTIMGPWGTGKIVAVNLDEQRSINGTVSVDANCLVTMTSTTVFKPEPPVAPKTP